ncbi:MAG: hypothetical protein GY797_02055, partial [Deltaproteobacteria bacterium]|nr:hypothetical protein [Deltaproteobacteria bacterium]
KNFYLFEHFSSSTWMGMSLSKLTVAQIPRETRTKMIQRGELSQLALLPSFSGLSVFKDVVTTPDKTGIPVLDREVKSSGASNYNNLAYIHISEQYLHDALYIIQHYPEVYFGALRKSFFRFFSPPTQLPVFFDNIIPILPVYKYYNATFYRPLVSCTVFLIVTSYGCLILLKTLLGKSFDRPRTVFILFIWINIIYVTLVGNFLEIGENHRFRFMLDPLLMTLLGIVLDQVFKRLGRRYQNHQPSGTSYNLFT